MKSAFETVIKKTHFKTCPGLILGLLNYLPTPVVTVQGYLLQEGQNLQSTRKRADRPAKIRVIKARFMRLDAKKNPG